MIEKESIMETFKRNWLSPIFAGVAVLFVGYVALVPVLEEKLSNLITTIDDRFESHEKIHNIEKENQLRALDNIDIRMQSYQVQISNATDKLNNLTVINQKIEAIADTKVRSVEGRLDSLEREVERKHK